MTVRVQSIAHRTLFVGDCEGWKGSRAPEARVDGQIVTITHLLFGDLRGDAMHGGGLDCQRVWAGEDETGEVKVQAARVYLIHLPGRRW